MTPTTTSTTTTSATEVVQEHAWAVVSVLLRYPTAELLSDLPALRQAAEPLPPALRGPVERFLGHVAGRPLLQLQQDYVATFDQRRKCCLYLSYYLNGDTRRRGMALVAFREVYRSAGVGPGPDELPDFLPMVLEFAATVDEAAGTGLLVTHRSGLAVLARALEGLGSPYADLVRVVEATLPPAQGGQSRVDALIGQGPPTEAVGLEPFGPPETTGRGVRT